MNTGSQGLQGALSGKAADNVTVCLAPGLTWTHLQHALHDGVGLHPLPAPLSCFLQSQDAMPRWGKLEVGQLLSQRKRRWLHGYPTL